MKIAVTDANIFIDLYHLGWLEQLVALRLEIHVTGHVMAELNDEQAAALYGLVESGALVIYTLSTNQAFALRDLSFPPGLSDADRSMLWYVQTLMAASPIVLSGDKLMRQWCQKNQIVVHGILWIFDQLVDSQQISHQTAVDGLTRLLLHNPRLPQPDCEERLKQWETAS